jgi:cytochrome c-type biogenesis protein CcmH
MVLTLASLAGATRQSADPPTGDALEALTVEVASQLRCPVCRQLSVQDSQAELAREVKGVIRERLAAGESPEEVKAYFVSKYGEWILLAPPKRGFTLLLWVLPVVAVLGGAGALAFFFRGWLATDDGA